MCATCGCGHKNYPHEMPKNVGSLVGKVTEKREDGMPKIPSIPKMPRSTK
jgi:hypothetical protein